MADFSTKAINARVDFNDKFRIKLGLPYADSDIRTLLKVNAKLRAALIEIEASGSCYCPRGIDGQRLGNKCSVCVARAALDKKE